MAFKKGDRYECTEGCCGCAIEVTKSAAADCTGSQAPKCCCGREMKKVS